MAAAVVRIAISTGATAGAMANAEASTVYNREDTLTGTAPVPKPTAAGTRYSWHKNLHLEVTTAGTTNISNRNVKLGSAPSAGLKLYYLSTATFAQAALAAADNGTTDDAVPAGYTALTTVDQVYDAASVATPLGKNGNYLRTALGVSNLYVGGAGNAVALPALQITFDES